MTKPVYKIETLTGAVLDHTIEEEASNIYTKEAVTDAIGHFSFNVPTVKGTADPYYYDDIAANDTIKIYFGYDSIAGGATPDFVGKVTQILGPMDTRNGYVRRIVGLSSGEILLRRLKTNQYWLSTAVSGAAGRIINSIASDLSLGTSDIDADATTIDMEVREKTYFDLLRDIADFWVSAGTQLKYDFYVDADNDLAWKARPIRTAGVESFTVGDDILSCRVTRDINVVKNEITVYGAAEKPYPSDYDSWTESSSGDWTLDDGDGLSDDSGDKEVGSDSLKGCCGALYDKVQFHRSITRAHIASINELHFWRKHSFDGFDDGPYLRIYAPDNSNYFEYTFSTGAGDAGWREIIIGVGSDNVYDADNNTTGDWHETGSPNWWSMEGLEVYADFNNNNMCVWIDGLYFFPDRWSNTASDATSQSNYGQRDWLVKDDKLHSDSDCQKRAETLLYQHKDPIVQIELTIEGNTNVLVGDRLSMTIPAENISAANYDIVSVEHIFGDQGFLTRPTMVNSANLRWTISNNPAKYLSDLRRQIRELSQDYYKTIR